MEKTNTEIVNAIKQLEKTQRIIISDIHNRLYSLEKSRKKYELDNFLSGLENFLSGLEKTEHKFYNKDINTNTWLVKCVKTGRTFSTMVWRNNVIKSQKCPCCGNSVRREN